MKLKVKFYWYSKTRVWEVWGRNTEDIVSRCHAMCAKYHCKHFEVLDTDTEVWA